MINILIIANFNNFSKQAPGLGSKRHQLFWCDAQFSQYLIYPSFTKHPVYMHIYIRCSYTWVILSQIVHTKSMMGPQKLLKKIYGGEKCVTRTKLQIRTTEFVFCCFVLGFKRAECRSCDFFSFHECHILESSNVQIIFYLTMITFFYCFNTTYRRIKNLQKYVLNFIS